MWPTLIPLLHFWIITLSNTVNITMDIRHSILYFGFINTPGSDDIPKCCQRTLSEFAPPLRLILNLILANGDQTE